MSTLTTQRAKRAIKLEHAPDDPYTAVCVECDNEFDDNGEAPICKTCQDWMVAGLSQ